jgi:peptidoglycan/LPS O-acetylase OafA/YrhL
VKKEFSIYLDLVRFVAACLVVIYHSNLRLISTEIIPFSGHGHAAVLVFFVLSGYVISYIVSVKESDPLDYWASRLSRFYALAIPAVLLAPLLDMAGEAMNPQFYEGKTTHDLWWLRIISSLTYTNEIWKISIMSFSNVPYWSLCYEMWYYVMFAIAAFTEGRRRVVLLALVMLFIGPKILILAPIWVFGVVLHRWQRLYALPEWQYWAMFLGSIPAFLLFQSHGMSEMGSQMLRAMVGDAWHKQATFSRYFIMDYPLALIIAANFVGFRGVAHHFAAPLIACERPIRWMASFTFSLYLLHQPLLQFFAALINGNPGNLLFYAEVMAATLASVVALGMMTEHKRGYLRDVIRARLVWLTGTRLWQRYLPMQHAIPAP